MEGTFREGTFRKGNLASLDECLSLLYDSVALLPVHRNPTIRHTNSLHTTSLTNHLNPLQTIQ
jgi:hypothetical protein